MCFMQVTTQGKGDFFPKHWDDAHVKKGQSMGNKPCSDFILKGNFIHFLNREYSRAFLVGNRLTLDKVARPILARPTITQTSQNPRTKAITDKMIIQEETVNNICWTIQGLVQVKAVSFRVNLWAKLKERNRYLVNFSLSALDQISISLFQLCP